MKLHFRYVVQLLTIFGGEWKIEIIWRYHWMVLVYNPKQQQLFVELFVYCLATYARYVYVFKRSEVIPIHCYMNIPIVELWPLWCMRYSNDRLECLLMFTYVLHYLFGIFSYVMKKLLMSMNQYQRKKEWRCYYCFVWLHCWLL